MAGLAHKIKIIYMPHMPFLSRWSRHTASGFYFAVFTNSRDLCKNVIGTLHFYRPDVRSIYASFSTETFIGAIAKRVEVQAFSGLVGSSSGGQNHPELIYIEVLL